MTAVRHSGLPVVLVAIFVAFSIPSFGQSPEEDKRPTFKEALKQYSNVRDKEGFTELHYAAWGNKLKFARYLINMGADLEARDPQFSFTPIHFAVTKGYVEMAELLVVSGADINAGSKHGFTPLHLAAHQGNHVMTRVLILLGADVSIKNYRGDTPLHTAALEGHLAAVGALLEGGADVNERGYLKQTALHMVCLKGHWEIAELLVSKGANVNAKSEFGSTPLNHAIAGRRGGIKEMLKRHGAVEGVIKRNRHFIPPSMRSYTVDFASVPTGARVRVDGKALCDETPCTQRLDPGTQQVSMQRAWHFFRTGKLNVEKKTALKWTLKQRPAKMDVMVLISKNFQLYHYALNGFEAAYRGSIEYHQLGNGSEATAKAFNLVQTSSPRMVLTVGLKASRWAAKNIHNIPIIFCMAMNPAQNRLKTKVSTGVYVDAPPGEQLSAFKQAIPSLRRVGIVYDPRRTHEFVIDAGQAATKLGLRLVHRQVSNEQQASYALWEISNQVDALWIIRDATTLTPVTFEDALEIQSEIKIPVLTFAEAFVIQGAFASYSADYHQHGAMAAQVAKDIQSGTLPEDIPIQHPPGGLMINLDVAEKLSSKLKVPPSVLFSGDVRKYKESWGQDKDLKVEKPSMR